jgi:sialic acid synthase SpsE
MNNLLVIPEIGHNHGGDLNRAKTMIRSVADAGLSIVKFQLYDTDKIKKPGETNYEELKKSEISKDEMLWLKTEAERSGLEFLCSVFDEERLEWYMETDPKRHKVASRSARDEGLVRAMAGTGLPLIISCGQWENKILPGFRYKIKADHLYCKTRRDILRDGFNPAEFPAKFNAWQGYSGFSDHTVGWEWAITAFKHGATILEKHYTINKNWPGWDQPGSGLPGEFSYFLHVIN